MRFPHPRQSGGTFLGLVLGLVLGLGVALVVALYVTKAPVPFVDRGILGATEEATQTQKNQNWNPNASFNQNQPLPSSPATEAGTSSASGAPTTAQESPAKDPLGDLIQQKSAATGADETPHNEAEATAPAPTPTAREAGQVQELVFYVQAGAFAQIGDADNQRAKLALMGVDTRVSQDTVNDRTVYRVRSGPYRTRSLALKTRQKLTDQNVESVVVAVPK